MAMAVLDRFSGGNDPEGWILRAEQYFTCLGFSQKDWIPLPYFYLDGEALTWFTWLHRNKQFFYWKHFKEKLLMQFPQRTTSVIVDLSPVTYSSDLEDAVTSGNIEAAHYMLEKLPEKYNMDSLALLTGSDVEIATLEGLETPQIGNAKSVESYLVQ
ncbi:hypothetical protein MTR67_007923 [Solanum verrucosum]|uniref:Uncharacterized protein n=1 Tax=Solanum verrucosum TaxID=315347 RepID=A0AAF0Q150_SOLVR|nr:hypothetical protein MTR67_007923 [Solanum verrucosum]